MASNLGLSGRLKRLEGKVEAAEVKENEEEEKKEGSGGMEGEEEVKEAIQDEKKTDEQKELKEVENAIERSDVTMKELGRKNLEEGDSEEKVKDGKRNSFRLDYITHMIRR